MNDMEIIEMYFRRDEDAIRQTEIKYGLFCRSLAYNILQIHEDAEEAVLVRRISEKHCKDVSADSGRCCKPHVSASPKT